MFTAFVNLVFLLHIPIGVLFVSFFNSVIYNYIPSFFLTISLHFLTLFVMLVQCSQLFSSSCGNKETSRNQGEMKNIEEQ